jgi:membrane protease YdiL (CAAX protease family)
VIAYGVFWGAAIALALIFGDPDPQPLVDDLKQEDALGVLLAWALLICIAAPIAEEFFFRGFIFTVFLRKLGLLWAVLLNGALFGALHVGGEAIQLVALGAFGAGLCLLYWRTKSIIPCMALHALNNSITFGVTKELDPGLFVATVVLSVGFVIAAGTAVSARTRVPA